MLRRLKQNLLCLRTQRSYRDWARPVFESPAEACGEGNGNPLQYSCLENSVDRGAWWAAAHGITQSRTWLKWLSSSSCNVVPLGVAVGGNDPYPSHTVFHLVSPLLQFTRLNLTCVHVCAQSLNRVWLFATPWTIATRLLCLWDFPGKNIRVGCHFLLQGIFPTQGSNRISCVSYIGRRVLYHCATWETQTLWNYHSKKKKKMKFKNSSMRCNLTCSFWDALVWERAI